MIKRIVLLLIFIFILSLSSPALAAEPGSGVIEGRVVNKTAGSSNVSDQDVTLNIYLDNAEAGSAATKTDAEGRFVFDGLSTEPGYSYGVTLTFQGAEYYSEWLTFGEGEITIPVEVTVYDSTTSDKALKVAAAHTIIYVGQGSLQVKEYFLFANESDRTYIGSREVAAATRETLRFFLPAEATELQSEYGLMECCIYSSEDGFIDTMPVLPGDKEVVYSYRVDYNSGAYIFSRKVNYPTANYDLLIAGEGTEVTSSHLTTKGILEIEGSRFKHLSGGGLAPDDIVVAQLSGLPETDNQRAIVWTAVALVVLVASFGFGYALRKRKALPVSPEDSLAQRRQGLLVELAQLDNDFESGKVPEEAYHRLRTEKKTQLVKLMQRSEEESGTR